jgi:hypothetical protein
MTVELEIGQIWRVVDPNGMAIRTMEYKFSNWHIVDMIIPTGEKLLIKDVNPRGIIIYVPRVGRESRTYSHSINYYCQLCS